MAGGNYDPKVVQFNNGLENYRRLLKKDADSKAPSAAVESTKASVAQRDVDAIDTKANSTIGTGLGFHLSDYPAYAKAAAANLFIGMADEAVHGAAYGVTSYRAQVPGLPFLTRGSKLPDDKVVAALTKKLIAENPGMLEIAAKRQAEEIAQDAAMADLKAQGFRGIVGLTHERNYDEKAAKANGINSLFLPLEDMSTPSRDQVGRFLQFISAPENRPVYVHCEAGLGRTGVMAGVAEIVLGHKTAQQVIAEFADNNRKDKSAPDYSLLLANQRDFLRLFEQLYKSPNPTFNDTAYGFPPPS